MKDRKDMKRIISCLLAAIMLISLVGCSGASVAQNGAINFPFISIPEANKLSFSPLSTTMAAVELKSLTIDGVDISNYKIVYSENPNKATYESSPYNKVVIQDTEYDKQTADNLAALIKTYFGATIPVVKDTDTAVSTYEINIGNTNRNLSSSVSSYLVTDKSYAIKETGGKLVICGTSYGATWQAAEAFVEYCLGLGTSSVAISKNFVKNGEANMLVVGCIGDSLTFGSGSSQGNSQGNLPHPAQAADRKKHISYPAALQRIAWKQMVVYNYGEGGRTMTEEFWWDDNNDGVLENNHAWTACSQYAPCMAKASDFDLVFLMLGTNDANSGRAKAAGFNYEDGTFESKYIASCTKIVNQLKEKNSDVRVVMMNCPISYRTDVESYAQTYIRGWQTKAASKLGLELLDMYNFTKTALHADSFPDTLHPNDEGYTIFAKGVYSMANPIIEELLGEDAQEDTTSYTTYAYIGTKPAGAPEYPVYATLAAAKSALGWGRNNIGWSYVLYVTEDIIETANLGTIRANVTIQAYSPAATTSANPTIKINMVGDTSNWMLPDTTNGKVTLKNVNVEVLEGGAYQGTSTPRNMFDPRNGATLTFDNVVLTTHQKSGYAIALRDSVSSVAFKNNVQFLTRKTDGTTSPCEKIWFFSEGITQTVTLDGAKINTTTGHLFSTSTKLTWNIIIKNKSELKVTTGKIFNNTGNATFNVTVDNSHLEATTNGGVVFDARGQNAKMNLTITGSTLKATNGQIFINQQVTSGGTEVSKETTFDIKVYNSTLQTGSGVMIRSLSIGGTMKAYIENSELKTSSHILNTTKADCHTELTLVGCTISASSTFVNNEGANTYVKVIIKDCDITTTATVFVSNSGENSEIILSIEGLKGDKAISGNSNFFKNTAAGLTAKINISDSSITSSGNVIYNNGTDATIVIEIFDGCELKSTSGSIVYNDKVIKKAEIYISDSTLIAGGDYVVGNKADATADTAYTAYLYISDSYLQTTKATGKAIYNYSMYSTVTVDVLSEKNADGSWKTQILAGNGTDGARALCNDSRSRSVMYLNVWGGHFESNGTYSTINFRNYGSVANIYDATIIADSAGTHSANMFAVQACDSTVNIYGGHIETKTTQYGTMAVRHNNGTNGTKMGAVNIYGGTIVAGNAACIGAGESKKDGQVNIWGGTFIKTGGANSYGVLGHNNTDGSYDKTYYIYGGTFITKDSADPKAYRLASSTSGKCLGTLNRAYDSVRMLTVTKATAEAYGIDWKYDSYADVCVITPKGTDLRYDMFGKMGYQVRSDATVDSESTDIRILVEVDKSVINNASYDNIGFSISVVNGNPTENTGDKVVSTLLQQPTVYSCVKEGNNKYYASEGYYFAVLEIKNIPNSSFDTYIYVRSYLMGSDGTLYYGNVGKVKVLPLSE